MYTPKGLIQIYVKVLISSSLIGSKHTNFKSQENECLSATMHTIPLTEIMLIEKIRKENDIIILY